MSMDPKHDFEWKRDQRWFFAELREIGVSYDDLCAALAGWPRPSAAGHLLRSRYLAALRSGGLDGLADRLVEDPAWGELVRVGYLDGLENL